MAQPQENSDKATYGRVDYSEGDILESPWGCVLVHSCNVQKGWGAGVASALNRALPGASRRNDEHRRDNDTDALLGHCLLIPPTSEDEDRFKRLRKPGERDDPHYGRYWVACLYSKEVPGPPTSREAKVDIVVQFDKALKDLKQQLESQKDTERGPGPLYCPPMNSGIFKVPWQVTEKVLEASGMDFHVKYLKDHDPRKLDSALQREVNLAMQLIRHYAPTLQFQDPTPLPGSVQIALQPFVQQSVENTGQPNYPAPRRLRNERIRYPGERAQPHMLKLAKEEEERDKKRRAEGPMTRSKRRALYGPNQNPDVVLIGNPPSNVGGGGTTAAPNTEDGQPPRRPEERPSTNRAATDIFDGLSAIPYPRLWALEKDGRYTLHPVASTSAGKRPRRFVEKAGNKLFGKHMRGPRGELKIPAPGTYQEDDVDEPLPPEIDGPIVPDNEEEKGITGEESREEFVSPGVPEIPGIPMLVMAKNHEVLPEYRKWIIWKEKSAKIAEEEKKVRDAKAAEIAQAKEDAEVAQAIKDIEAQEKAEAAKNTEAPQDE